MKTLVVVNPKAGHGRIRLHWPRHEKVLRDILHEPEVVFTEQRGHAAELTRKALLEGYERIVSVGGDGTHHEVVNGFFNQAMPINPNATLGILPAGTGSDLARTLGLSSFRQGLEVLASGKAFGADVGRVQFTSHNGEQSLMHFINVADFGAGGAVAARVNRSSKRFGGFASYLWAVVRTLLTFKNPRVHLEIDGECLEQRCNNVIIANGQYYGGGMHVAPEASLTSGHFEIFVIGDVTRREAFQNLPRLYRGTLKERPDLVRYFCARQIKADSDEEVLLNLDGEQPGRLPAVVQTLPSALLVIAPGRR
ncbi:MAG: diacylglycerol kinase family lipid kinase [Candidatus Hydrogenedentes bacterium]|nr:diacylglycerol kinase family lipid kinase [Candidatus Hydrogenedentota bacterium]